MNRITSGVSKHIEAIKYTWRCIPSEKRVKYVYFGIGAVVYTQYNYSDARSALEKKRLELTSGDPEYKKKYSYSEEWKYIHENIYYTQNLIDAVFFPLTVFQRVIPTLVISMNPK